MWQAIVRWFKSLYGSEATPEEFFDEPDYQHFSGWIRDEPDARDHVFVEQK